MARQNIEDFAATFCGKISRRAEQNLSGPTARQRVLFSLPTARASDVPHKGTQIIDLSKWREQLSPLIVFALATHTGIVPDICSDVQSG